MVGFLRNICRSIWKEVEQFLSFFDLLRFCRYLGIIDKRKEAANQKKNKRNLRLFFNIGLATKFVQKRETSLICLTINSLTPKSLSYNIDSTFAYLPPILKRRKCCMRNWSNKIPVYKATCYFKGEVK